MANLLKGGCVTQVSIMQNVRDPLRLHLNQENVKSAKKWLSYGSLPMGGCVTQVSIMPDEWDLLGLHLNQKHLKSGKKWLSYG